MATKQIVITGAAGMIGSGVVKYLNELGWDHLILVDDFGQSNKWKNLVGKRFSELIPRAKLLSFLNTRTKEIDAILHLGACSDTTETDGDYLLENNFRYTTQLAQVALTAGIRLIYASSAATYGDGSSGFSDHEEMLEQLMPLNMYGYSKHLVDLWMKKENVLNQVVSLKYFNVFGPNEYHKRHMASFIFKMAHKAELGEVIPLFQSNDLARYAHGEQVRDFIYLKDAVRMTCSFLLPEYRHLGGVYNIGHGTAVSWNAMATYLCHSFGRDPKITYIEMPQNLRHQYQNYTCAEMSKFHRDIPNMKMMPISSAVEEYVNAYLRVDQRW